MYRYQVRAWPSSQTGMLTSEKETAVVILWPADQEPREALFESFRHSKLRQSAREKCGLESGEEECGDSPTSAASIWPSVRPCH